MFLRGQLGKINQKGWRINWCRCYKTASKMSLFSVLTPLNTGILTKLHTQRSQWALPADGGELGLLLHLFSKDLQLLLERFLVVVGVDVVVVRHHRWQELRTSEAEKFLKYLQVADMEKGSFHFIWDISAAESWQLPTMHYQQRQMQDGQKY